jgi:hypothetical protein
MASFPSRLIASMTVCDLVQSFALFWPRRVQQVGDFDVVMYVKHAALMVDVQVVIQIDETVEERREFLMSF